MFNGRRQPSRDSTSRMTREYQVRFCERLGVKFPGPTRQKATSASDQTKSGLPLRTDILGPSWDVRFVPEAEADSGADR